MTRSARCLINSVKQQHRLPRMDSLHSWRFSTQLEKAQSGLFSPHTSPCHEREVRPETSRAPSQREPSYSPVSYRFSCAELCFNGMFFCCCCCWFFVCLFCVCVWFFKDKVEKKRMRMRIYKVAYCHIELYESENIINIKKKQSVWPTQIIYDCNILIEIVEIQLACNFSCSPARADDHFLGLLPQLRLTMYMHE